MEEMNVNSTIAIAEGTQICWNGKHIHLNQNGLIDCTGTLILEDCVIYSREKGYTGQIRIKGKGQIKASNCTFLNYGHNGYKEVIRFEDTKVRGTFEGCRFENCTEYIKFVGTLEMIDCQFVNCLFNTVQTRWCGNDSACRMENITIKNNEFTATAKKSMKETYGCYRVISIETKKCMISNVRISEGPEFSKIVLKNMDKHFNPNTYIYTDGVIDNITMEKTTMTLCSTKLIQQGKFLKCIYPLQTKAEQFRGRPTIKECEFLKCTDTIYADHRSKVEECTFSHCYGNLIEQRQFSDEGKISVDKCRFLNCANETKEFNRSFRYMVSPGTAMLFFRGSKKSETSTVRNCLIEGMVLNEGYFVATETLDKTPECIVSVSNCKFVDCYTNRNDYEIFKRSAHYYGALGQSRDNLALQVLNCSGLDEIKNDFVDDFDEFEFDEDDIDVQYCEDETVSDMNAQVCKQSAVFLEKQGCATYENLEEDNDRSKAVMDDIANQLFRTMAIFAKTKKKDH